ncbi:MAG: VCBS repeat-containing protein [Pseudomonadota bacterium]
MGLSLGLASPGAADIAAARFIEPTERYGHGVLGETSEHAAIAVTFGDGRTATLRWDRPMVFEDVAPRLLDIDGDGARELLVVESHEDFGARFAVYNVAGDALVPLTRNPFIGTRFRWLAIVGAADLDGDGAIEIAYVDRPHLARTLRVWRLVPEEGGLGARELASLTGVTNHRIGEEDIAGGLRDCGAGPEMIVADAAWDRIISVRLDGSGLTATDIGPHRGRASFAAAMGC